MINKEKMKEMIKLQAAHRPVAISDKQIEDCMDEAEEMWNTTNEFLKGKPLEQQVIGAFVTGVLFGLDQCDRKKEEVFIIKA